MNLRATYDRVLVILLVLAFISGLAFYFNVVFNSDISNTNPLSVIFGWQWFYLFVASVVVLILAIARQSKQLLKASATILISLLIVFVPAQFIFSKGLYITGDGGPAGPDFNCLVWKEFSTNSLTNTYHRGIGLCSLMSIPSFNKFLIDRSQNADQTDNSASYYTMLVINEAVLVGGLILARRSMKKALAGDTGNA